LVDNSFSSIEVIRTYFSGRPWMRDRIWSRDELNACRFKRPLDRFEIGRSRLQRADLEVDYYVARHNCGPNELNLRHADEGARGAALGGSHLLAHFCLDLPLGRLLRDAQRKRAVFAMTSSW
jgi:hypothetical protein